MQLDMVYIDYVTRGGDVGGLVGGDVWAMAALIRAAAVSKKRFNFMVDLD
jgi:hypothetical protein